jgi:hypothetical protein
MVTSIKGPEDAVLEFCSIVIASPLQFNSSKSWWRGPIELIDRFPQQNTVIPKNHQMSQVKSRKHANLGSE